MTDLTIKPKPGKIDKRTKNGKKLDIAQVIKLRDVQELSFPEIGKIVGYDQGYINRMYHQFKGMVKDADTTNTFTHNRTNILTSMELDLLQNMSKPDKLEKASLNNIAYTYNQIHTARRLEEGKGTAGGVTVNIEIAYQEATELSRKVRLKHAGTGTTVIPDEAA